MTFRQDLRKHATLAFYSLYAWEGDPRTMKLVALAWQVYRCYRRGQGDTNEDGYQDLAFKREDANAQSHGGNLHALDRAAS